MQDRSFARNLGASVPPSIRPVVKQVDHVTISCSDPPALFNTLTRALGLPAAWPLGAYPGFTTGGVFAGNVNLETLRFDTSARSLPEMPPFTFIYGIVFESHPLDQVTGEFKRRGGNPGVPHNQMREMNGTRVKVWTNVTLQSICTNNYIVYLCEYTPEMKTALVSRSRSATGPLGGIGLIGVREIGIVSSRPDQTRELWATVFAPAPLSADGVLSFEAGPTVRISQGGEDQIERLVFRVASLQSSREFLVGAGMLGETSANEIKIDPTAVQGLDIRLVEA
jgi:catechol 2,3-dioxygenase-like lactoylglutathione lyase family enzyme